MVKGLTPHFVEHAVAGSSLAALNLGMHKTGDIPEDDHM